MASNVKKAPPKRFDFVKDANPSTFNHWQTACAYVKYLYLKASYDACVSRCDELLKSPKIHDVHSAFIHFYAGLCCEILAETQGTEHPEFHTRLDTAERHLEIALGMLPVPPTKNTPAPQVRHKRYETSKKDTVLQQQRSSSESSRPETEWRSHRDSKSSQTTPGSASPDASPGEEECSAGARGRYHRILMSLKPELESHIAYIRTLRQDSTEVVTRSNSHAGGKAQLQETMAKVAVKQRVVDGRKRNWKRARFSMIPQPQSWQNRPNEHRSVS